MEFVLHQHPLKWLARIKSVRHNPQKHLLNDYLFLLQLLFVHKEENRINQPDCQLLYLA